MVTMRMNESEAPRFNACFLFLDLVSCPYDSGSLLHLPPPSPSPSPAAAPFLTQALLEFGGLYQFFSLVADLPTPPPLVDGGINGPSDPALARLGATWGERNRGAMLIRRDGRNLTQEDEDALLEYAGFRALFELAEWVWAGGSTASDSFGFFPREDDDMSEVGMRWGQEAAEEEQTALERKDHKPMTENDHHALLRYGGWVWVGTLLLTLYNHIFSMREETSQKTSSQSTGGAGTGIHRSPSGAELSATLGMKIAQSVGLTDPSRRVRARGTL